MKIVLLTIPLFILVVSCNENKSPSLDFLVGTWKIDEKEQYEYWEKNEENELIGNSYQLVGNVKSISETLRIRKAENQLIYEATVPDQNDGKTIEFILNPNISEFLSFENANHDFPKKIQYKKINSDSIEVHVLGEKDRGFSYLQIKQKK